MRLAFFPKWLSLKPFLPRTLFGRSLLILILPVLLIQVVVMIAFFDRHWSKMTIRLAYAVSGEIAVAVDAFQQGDSAFAERLAYSMGRYLDLEMAFEPGGVLPFGDQGGSVQFLENVVVQRLRRELEAQISEPFAFDFNFANKVITVYVQLQDGVLKINLPERRLFSSSGHIFLLWVAGVSGLLLLISVLFMRNQVRPIRKLAVAAERFGKGQDVPRFKPEGAHEVRQAAQAFLDMRRRIQRQVSQRTDMLAGVSHDLRTPLTRLKLELEMLAGRYDVEAMKTDIHEMERMISGYLDFVRGDGEEAFESILLENVFQKILQALERQNIEIKCDIEPGLRVRVRPLAFERALSNLVMNAVKYGKRVWVKAFLDDRKLQIQVEDDGPGIPEPLYEEMFKPFKRADNSRNTETGGVGLGLSIAMDVIQSHGGNIVLSRSSYGGLCATVRVPV